MILLLGNCYIQKIGVDMAYWVTHLRINEAVLNKLNLSVNKEKYFIGSIAADCGIQVYDKNGRRGYDPPRYISH